MTPDVVSAAPTIHHSRGRAWRVDLEKVRRSLDGPPDAAVALWIVEATWAHPLWHSYAISLVHLRPMPDNRRTLFYLAGATHELVVDAMDPRVPREAAIAGDVAPARLRPTNFAGQFIADSDEAAAQRIANTVADICCGRLSPDTDHLSQWVARYGDHMVKRHHSNVH